MEVVLLAKVAGLGRIGDRVKVKGGYGRNFLLPKGLAVLATPENVIKFEERRAQLEQAEAEVRNKAIARSEAFKDLVITLSAKTADEGRLFGSVGVSDVIAGLASVGVEVQKNEVHLPEGLPIRQLGEYEVSIHLHSEVTAVIKVVVISE